MLEGEVKLEEWTVGGLKCIGTRLKSSNARHGLVRKIWPDGDFEDTTYVNDKEEGLAISFWRGEVII